MEAVGRRVGVKNDGHRVGCTLLSHRSRSIQHGPGKCALAIVNRGCVRPTKSSAIDQFVGNSHHSRLLRLIKVQTTRIVTGFYTQRDHLGFGHELLAAVIKPCLTTSPRSSKIWVNRLIAFGDELEA